MTTTEKPAEKLVPVDEPDPMWDIEVGDISQRQAEELREYWDPYGDNHCNARNREAVEDGTWVGEDRYDGYVCTRNDHPDHWKHIATAGRRVIGYWGGTDPKDLAVVPEDVDSDEPFALEIGKLYKFRNRRTLLMVVGKRRESGVDKVEVLDLDHEKYRVLDSTKLAPRREDMVPTAQQLKWIAQFMAKRRQEVRDNALQQRRDGYFKTARELNGILTELGLEPYLARRQGGMRPSFQIRTTGLDDSEAKRRLADWFKTLTPPPGIEFTELPAGRYMGFDLYDAT